MNEVRRGHEVKERLDQVSPSFCLAKWKQVTLHLHNGNTQSCHHVSSHQIKPESLKDPAALHNTPEKIQARKEMLNGKRPSECDYCWKIEDLGEISDRTWKSGSTWAWPRFEEVLKEGLDARVIPSSMEISFDSICQFKCMYCSPAYSTKWQSEIEEFGPYPTSGKLNSLEGIARQGVLPHSKEEKEKFVNAFWSWWPELAPKLEEIRVTGGEPFLAKDTFRLMDDLIANPQPHLIFSINTNMGFTLQHRDAFLQRIEALQKSVKKIFIFTSIDTTGAQAEYIRFGLNCDSYWDNVRTVLAKSEKKIAMTFMVTVNNLCLPGLKDLVSQIRELRLQFPQHEIGIDTPYLRHPMFMSVELLSKAFMPYIDQTVAFMEKHSDASDPAPFSDGEIQRVSRIRELMTNRSFSFLQRITLKRDFYKMFMEYDRRRGTEFLKTFPEYEAFWLECSRYSLAW